MRHLASHFGAERTGAQRLQTVLCPHAAALLAFAYFLSTLFQASRVAGMASAMLYALAMVPGCDAASITWGSGV